MFPLFMASLLIAFLVCSYILLSRDFSFDAAKKLLIEEGGAEGWFETHGLEITTNPNDSGTLRGKSPDGLVSVEIDVPSFSELTPKSNVTITLDIGDSVLSHVDISMKRTGTPHGISTCTAEPRMGWSHWRKTRNPPSSRSPRVFQTLSPRFDGSWNRARCSSNPMNGRSR